MGVEEEYFLVDPASRMPNCSAPRWRGMADSPASSMTSSG
jgi:hypothetical protein